MATPAPLDPEAFRPCPYDSNHVIRNKRVQIHLIQCRKNNPKIAKRMKKCPFNATHIVPEVELEFHKEQCPDRMFVLQEILHKSSEHEYKSQRFTPPIVNHDHIESNENWDDEICADFYSYAPPTAVRVPAQKSKCISKPPTGIDPDDEKDSTDSVKSGRNLSCQGCREQPDKNVSCAPPHKQGICVSSKPAYNLLPGVGRGCPQTAKQQMSSSAFEVDTVVGRPCLPEPDHTSESLPGDCERKPDIDVRKEERKLRKKLKEILKLEEEAASGKNLNEDQMRKLFCKAEVEKQLLELSI